MSKKNLIGIKYDEAMKRTLHTISMLALAGIFFSCEKEHESHSGADMVTVKSLIADRGTFLSAGGDSKATLADGNSVVWSAGDKLSVFTGTGSNMAAEGTAADSQDWRKGYTFQTSEGGRQASFSCTDSAFTEDEDFLLLFPGSSDFVAWQDKRQFRCWVDDDQVATLNSFQSSRGVAVAKAASLDETVRFKNVMALLKFTIPASMAGKITKIAVAGNAGEYMAGDILVDYAGEQPQASLWYSAYGNKSKYQEVRLTDENGMAAGNYYLSILPTSVSGITVTVSLSDGRKLIRSSSSAFSFEGGKIYKMGEISSANYDFDGVKGLPYVLSLTSSAQNTATFVSLGYSGDAGSSYDLTYTDLDGTGAYLLCREAGNSSSPANTTRLKYSATGANSIIGQYFVKTQESFYKLVLPVGAAFPSSFSVVFGTYGEACFKNWKLHYSKDNSTWTYGGQISLANKAWVISSVNVSIPENFHLVPGDILYLRLQPDGNSSTLVNNSSGDGWGGTMRIWGGVVLTALEEQATTAVPSGAVYFEPFDRMAGGVDYLMGGQANGRAKLGVLANAFGTDIASWTEAQKNGLSGSSVAMRPGYVQIGHPAATQGYASGFSNTIGSLVTPALSAGTLSLSFKAMAYQSTLSTSIDSAEARSIELNIIGGGTFDGGAASLTVNNVPCDAFQTYSYTIKNATASTRIEFTSPTSAPTTRWFLDDICVK